LLLPEAHRTVKKEQMILSPRRLRQKVPDTPRTQRYDAIEKHADELLNQTKEYLKQFDINVDIADEKSTVEAAERQLKEIEQLLDEYEIDAPSSPRIQQEEKAFKRFVVPQTTKSSTLQKARKI
jgi:hypothetical protein